VKPWGIVGSVLCSLKGSNIRRGLFDPFRVGDRLPCVPRVAGFALTLGYYIRPFQGQGARSCNCTNWEPAEDLVHAEPTGSAGRRCSSRTGGGKEILWSAFSY